MKIEDIVKVYYEKNKSLSETVKTLNGKIIPIEVEGLFGEKLLTEYGVIDDIVLINPEKACESPPKKYISEVSTSTRGLGEVISNGLKNGYKDFIIEVKNGLGDDVGIGMLEALGYIFLDENDKRTSEFINISNIDYSNVDRRLGDIKTYMLCEDEFSGGLSSSLERYLNGRYLELERI